LPAKFIELWDEGEFDIVMSQPIYNEISEVLDRFDRISFEIRQKLLFKIRANAEWLTEIPPKVDVIKDDKKDNMFLECAMASKVEYIISGDHHLLSLGEYQGIMIINVREFLRLLGKL